MASLSNQIKSKLQQIGSPKLKLGGQSPTSTNFYRVPTVGKISHRDAGNTSQSPEDQSSRVSAGTGSNSGSTAIQRIQMKNVAFIPAKAQSPISHNQAQNQTTAPNLSNFNISGESSKISPQRLITTAGVGSQGNKMIIPANQIKLAKKDGNSPSPEARQLSKQGPNNGQQNQNPNMIMPGGDQQVSKTANNQEHGHSTSSFGINVGAGNDSRQIGILQDQTIQQRDEYYFQRFILNTCLTGKKTYQDNSAQNDKQRLNDIQTIQQSYKIKQSEKNNFQISPQQQHHSTSNAHSHHNFHHQQPMSDDETTVMSDGEDKVKNNMSSLKHDHHPAQASQNNFNRPKLNNQSTASLQSDPSQSQIIICGDSNLKNSHRGSTHNDQQNKIKIISTNKIRQSPSPPPNQVLKLQKPPSVTNIQIQVKHQQQQQPQLATDFIKGMINQSRTNNAAQNGGTISQKKIGGIKSTLKIKNDITNNQQQNFVKDMKKHGLIKDIQDVSQMNQMLSENSPVRQDDNSQILNTSSLAAAFGQQTPLVIFHHRNYSPPPNFTHQGASNIQKIYAQKQSQLHQLQTQDSTLTNTTGLNDSNKDILANVPHQESSPLNTSNQEDTSTIQQNQENGANGGVSNGTSVFQFPFQRRARSLSLPKQEIIQSKLGQNKNAQQQLNGQEQSQQNSQQQQQKKSPSPTGDRNLGGAGPVVAKINFVIAQKGALGQSCMYPQEDETMFERNKEVDEWLMGSGESDNTAGSNNSIPNQLLGNLSHQKLKLKQSELEKPIQPGKQKDGDDDDHSVEGEEEEDWMFKTFNAVKKNQSKNDKAKSHQPKQQQMPGRSRLNEETFEDVLGEQEDSPFDMAPEMSKVIPAKGQFIMFDGFNGNEVDGCNDISQYIEKIDSFMEKIY